MEGRRLNKIFKVVWSKTKHCYVVTSELAKTHTKSNQTKSEVDGQGKGGFLGTGVSSAEMALRASLCAAVLTGAAIGVAQAAEKQLQVSYTGLYYGTAPNTTGVAAPTWGVVSVGSGTNTRRITNVAAGLAATDAVNVSQLNSLAGMKVTVQGDSGTDFAATLGNSADSTYTGPKFKLAGNTDITTTASSSGVSFALNKATQVTSGDTKAVTADAVYKYVNSSVSGAANLAYKASGESGTNSVALSSGLNFTPDGTSTGTSAASNVLLSTAANGVVNIGLAKDLTGISSIKSSGGAKMALGSDTITFSSGDGTGKVTLTGLADGKNASDAVTVHQFTGAMPTVVAGNYATVTSQPVTADGLSHTQYTVGLNKDAIATDLSSTFAKVDASNITTDTNKAAWRTALNVYTTTQTDAAITAARTTVDTAANSGLTVTKGSAADHNAYTIALDQTNLQANTKLAYKADGANAQSTSLATGLNFTSGTNTTATVDASGVVKYDVKSALTGINSISGGTSGATVTLGSTANTVDMGGAAVKNIANATADSDAVAYGQVKDVISTVNSNTIGNQALADKITGIADSGITLGDNSSGTTTKQKFSSDVNLLIQGDSAGDITTAVNSAGNGLNITLSKDSTVTSTGTKAVTGAAVYSAVTGTKTKVVADSADTSGILTITKTESTDLNPNSYKLGIDTTKLKTAVSADFAAKDASNLTDANVTSWKTKLGVVDAYSKTETYNQNQVNNLISGVKDGYTTVTLDSTNNAGLTLTDTSTTTGQHAYKLGLNGTTIAQNTSLSYKASGDADAKSVTLENGLTFNGDSNGNIVASTGANGNVTYSLSSTLSGISSISNGGKTIAFTAQGVDFAGLPLNNIGTSTNASSAATVGQLNAVKTGADATQTDLNALKDNTIRLYGDDKSTSTVTNAKKLSASPLSFDITGNDDITTAATTTGVSLALNKITDLTSLNSNNISSLGSRVATSGAVYNAIVGAKTKVEAGGLLTLTKTESTDLNPNTYTVSIDAETIKRALNVNGDGELQGSIDYKANGGAVSSVGLTPGFNFTDGTNTKATVAAEGVVTFDLKDALTGIKSIANNPTGNGSQITLSSATNEISMNGGKVTNVAAGTDSTDAVNKSQLDAVAAKIGTATNGSNGTNGPAGQDGLDGKNGQPPQSLTDKVNALRNGTAGNMVYTAKATDGSQERLVMEDGKFYRAANIDTNTYAKAIDGKWYKQTDLNMTTGVPNDGATAVDFANVFKSGTTADGSQVATTDVNISAVNANGSVNSSTPLLNITSALGLLPTTTDTLNSKALGGSVITAAAASSVVGAPANGSTPATGIYAAKGAALNQAVTLADLQAVAQAGLNFTGNSLTGTTAIVLHAPVNSTVAIQGKDTYDSTTYDAGDNISTKVDTTKNQILITMKKSPSFTSVVVGDTGKQVTVGTDTNGNLHVSDNETPSSGVVINGVKDGTTADSVVTKGALDAVKSQLGLDGTNGTDGTNGGVGPAGKDGLNGHSIVEKVQNQRDGLSGNMVYTDTAGNRLVKGADGYYPVSTLINANLKQANNGMWYPAANVNPDGSLATGVDASTGKTTSAALTDLGATKIPDNQVQISTVNADGNTTDPTVLRNVGSTLTLNYVGTSTTPSTATVASATKLVNGDSTATNANDKAGLLGLTGTVLNNAATLGEVQAVAQAGLNFGGDTTTLDSTKVVHRALGSEIDIVGGGYTASTFSSYASDNVATLVDTTNNKIRIMMKTAPTFKGITLDNGNGNAVSLAPVVNGSGSGVKLSDASGKPVAITGVASSTDPTSAVTLQQLKDATAAIGGNGVDGATGPAGKDGLNGQSMGTQLVSLRSGTAGNTVYTTDNSATDKSQVRLLTDGTNFVRADSVKNYTQASDGKWYANADVVNGVARAGATPATMSQVLAGLPTVEASKINISNVNADGTVTNPTKLMNVASALTNVSDLKTASGAALNQAATVGDLQKLQAAGTTFAGNTGFTTVGIGETLNVKGGASSYTASDFSGDNLYTVVSGNNLNVVMKKAPSFTSVTVGDSGKQVTIGTDTDGNLHVTDKENPTGGVVITGVKDGTTADSVVTKGALDELRNSITNGKDGANGTNGTPGAGVAGINGTNGHDGVAGADGSVGPSGKDGLAGHNIFDKIEPQREGLSGNMVYTDPSGARLVKVDGAYYPASTFDGLKQGTDGKYYPAAGVSADGTVDPAYADQGKSLADVIADKNATAVPSSSVIISTVNPTGETTTPTVIGNVKSTIGLDGTTTNQDGSVTTNGPIAAAAATTATQGLLEKSGAALNNAATVGDLQAVAQAGMTYQTNDKTGSTPQSVAQTVHTPLGSTLSIIGGENNVYKPTSSDKYTPGGYTADNLVTTVTSDGKIQVAMSDAPVFKAATVGDATLTFYKDPNQRLGYVSVTYRDNGVAGTGVDGVVVQGLRTSSDPTSAATKGYVDNKINGSAVVTAPTIINSPSAGDHFDQAGMGVQVLALRNGVSGPVVYTDANGVHGMRATQAIINSDGSVSRGATSDIKLSALDGYKLAVDSSGNPLGWFKADSDIWKQEIVSNGAGGQVVSNTNQLKDGLSADILKQNVKTFGDGDKLQGKIVLSLVSPNGQTEGSSTDNNQVVLHNVDSGLSMLNSTATDSKGVVKDLIDTTADANLHYAANLTDLKTLATAGLDFNGNAGDNIHKNLGEKLSITGTAADTSTATHVETIVPAGNPAGLPANNQFSAENVMTWSDANGLRIGISSNPVFNNVTFGGNTNNPITIVNNGSGDLQIKDKDGNTRTIITGTVNGFYIADKNNNKSLVKLGDTINFGDYLQVVPGTNTDSSTSNGGTSNSGTSGSGSTDSGTSGSGSTTTSGDGGTVNVTGLVSKTDFDNAITNINNKISNIDISSLKPTGTIGTGQDTDKQAVSGETVKDYLDQNYTNNAQLNERFTKLSKQANAGTASALAAAGIPQVTNMYDDNLMIGAGMGSYGGETAVAIGISGTNDNRDTTYRISTTYDSTGKWGLSGGVGFSIGSGSNTPKPQAAKALAERVDRLEAENKALRQSNETEIKDLAAKNDQLQAQVQQLQAMIQQLMPQTKLGAQAAAPAAQTPDKAADATQNKEEAKTAPTSSAAR